jgi:hypothetical protein
MMAERKGNEMKLTLKYLKKIYACEKAMDWFEENYGDETEITPEFVEHAENTDGGWIPWLMVFSLLDMVKTFIENGADIHAHDDLTLLRSVEDEHLDMVKFLIKNGANIHAQDDLALRRSAYKNNLDMAKHLIENGANIHARDDLALRWSVEDGYLDMVKLLVENGADIHARGDRALEVSTHCGYHEITEYLQSIIDKEKQENERK